MIRKIIVLGDVAYEVGGKIRHPFCIFIDGMDVKTFMLQIKARVLVFRDSKKFYSLEDDNIVIF